MANDSPGTRTGLDPEAREWLDRYVAHWEPDLRERGLITGDPPRLRQDFLEAVVRAWRGQARPPIATTPPAPDVPEGRPEG